MNAPANTLGKTDTTTAVSYALIGTYCTTNNNGNGGLSNNEDTYTGDFITIAGKLICKNSYCILLGLIDRDRFPLEGAIKIFS